MNPGAMLIGAAAVVLLVVYVARPLRRRVIELDDLIEAWIAQEMGKGDAGQPSLPSALGKGRAPSSLAGERANVEATSPQSVPPLSEGEASQQEETEAEQPGGANFCHQCGRPVKPYHRFCPNCGARLIED